MSASSGAAVGEPSSDATLRFLRTGGWLADDGKLLLRTNVKGNADLTNALCEYAFGTTQDVSNRIRLSAEATLAPGSGPKTSATGGFVLCGYAVGGNLQVALEVGHSDDEWSNGLTTLVRDGDVHAVVSYVPDYAGPRIAPAAARTWLAQVLRRISY